MNKQLSGRKITSVARCEYLKWIADPRNILLIIMVVFAKTLCIDALMERAVKFGGKLNILEPFAAVGNSGMLVMLIPAVYLVLMSDFPKFDGNSLFFIKRTGKANWLMGQILFACMSIASYLVVVFLLICLCSLQNAKFGISWSDVTRLYVSRFPDEYDSFASQLLPSNLYNQVDLIAAILHTLALMALYLFLLSMILLVFRLLAQKTMGMMVNLCVIAVGVATCSLKSSAMWWFPMGNTIIWLHYTEIMRSPIKPIWYSYAYFAVLIFTLIAICYMLIKRISFIFEENA